MNNKLLTIILLFVLILGAIFSNVIRDKKQKSLDITTNVVEVTKNAKLIDLNTDHNQVLDVVSYAKRHKIKVPEILINFDTHSDIYMNKDVLEIKESSVASWINNLLVTNPQIKTIYWVMPMEEAQDLNLRITFGVGGAIPEKDDPFILFGNILDKNLHELTFVFTPLYKKAFKQEFYINPKTGYANEIPKDKEVLKQLFETDESQLRKFEIITCTEKTLPNLKGKDVLLSIDADYISNSGFDTYADFKFIKKDEHEVNAAFYSIFKTLKDKEIKPTIISLSLSPRYLPDKHHVFVDTIFKYIILTANKFDMIDEYKHRYIDTEEAGD